MHADSLIEKQSLERIKPVINRIETSKSIDFDRDTFGRRIGSRLLNFMAGWIYYTFKCFSFLKISSLFLFYICCLLEIKLKMKVAY